MANEGNTSRAILFYLINMNKLFKSNLSYDPYSLILVNFIGGL
jgi:hypothetical protein